MDSREAREILSLHRPGTLDDADPRMAAALEQARRDPELAAWFEQQSAVHSAIRAKLKAIPVPPNLKRDILLGQLEQTRVVRLPVALKFLAAAAALALLAALAWVSFHHPRNPYDFATFRNRMARRVQRDSSYMDMTSTNQTEILDYCQQQGGPANIALPANLQPLEGEGGSVFPFNNRKVAMLCLNAASDGTKNDLWLFVVDKSVLPDPPPARPQFLQVANLMTASWTEGGKVFVLAAAGTPKDLQKYLPE
jgi:putative hemolysin